MKRRSFEWRRWLALLVGLYITGLPTYYAIVELGATGNAASHARHFGIFLFIAWAILATVGGYLALISDREVVGLLRRRRHLMINERQRDSGQRAINLMLNNPDASKSGLLRNFSPKIYVVDDVDHPTELLPLFDDDPPDHDRWPLTEGVVGLAFTDDDPENPLVIAGDALTQATAALANPAQREQFADLLMVAAIVIRDVSGRPIGVLSCSSSLSAGGFGTARREAIKVLATDLGVMLPLVR